LSDIPKYTGLNKSLYCPERDSHALVSAQSCFLPVPPKQTPAVYFGATPPIQDPTKFYISIYNYQSTATDSAVLAIVATSKGTSAQLLLKSQGGIYAGQKLYFNSNGSKNAFLAQRLTYDRILRGEKDLTKPMTAEERQNNAIVVIQVPLKIPDNLLSASVFSSFTFGSPAPTSSTTKQSFFGPQPSAPSYFNYDKGASPFAAYPPTNIPYQPAQQNVTNSPYTTYTISKIEPLYSPLIQAPMSTSSIIPSPSKVSFGFGDTKTAKRSPSMAQKSPPVDIENAIISLAESEGIFPSLEGKSLERDERYPVRVTIQWYKVTSSGNVSTEVVDEIHQQMQVAKSQADFWGSLVVDKAVWEKQNNRPTEIKPSSPTPNPIVGKHPDTVCDVCKVNFKDNEVRYRCMYCPDWDVCQNCFSSHNHPSKHLLAAVKDSTSHAIQNNARMANKTNLVHNVQCITCHSSIVGARYVCAVCNGGIPGKAAINLCDSCADNGNHAENRHPLIRVWYSEDLRQIGLE
jgi:Zinc finger, ZZ type